MFSGLHTHRLDEKGRVSIPKEFRAAGDGKFFITVSPDGALLVYDEAGFDRMRSRLNSMDDFDSRVRWLKRIFLMGPEAQSCDDYGRLKLTPKLIQFAGLKKDVIVQGLDDYFELWDKERYELKMDEELKQFDQYMRQLSSTGKT